MIIWYADPYKFIGSAYHCYSPLVLYGSYIEVPREPKEYCDERFVTLYYAHRSTLSIAP